MDYFLNCTRTTTSLSVTGICSREAFRRIADADNDVSDGLQTPSSLLLCLCAKLWMLTWPLQRADDEQLQITCCE